MEGKKIMDNSLFIYSSNELSNARNVQQQISQKEFEIKLVEINANHTSYLENSTYFYNQQRKALMEMEVSNLKSQRDGHINASLVYALSLAEIEIMSNLPFSNAAIAISSIYSFLSIYNIQLILNSTVIVKISSVSSQLLLHPGDFMPLRMEIVKLKVHFHMA